MKHSGMTLTTNVDIAGAILWQHHEIIVVFFSPQVDSNCMLFFVLLLKLSFNISRFSPDIHSRTAVFIRCFSFKSVFNKKRTERT